MENECGIQTFIEAIISVGVGAGWVCVGMCGWRSMKLGTGVVNRLTITMELFGRSDGLSTHRSYIVYIVKLSDDHDREIVVPSRLLVKCPNDRPWVGCFVQNLSQGPKPPNTKTLQLIPQKGLCWSSSFLQMPWTLDKTWPDSVISDIFWSSHKKCRDFHGFWCVLVDPGADARAWARFASGCPTCWSAEGVFDANGGFHDARACDCHWTPRHESLHRLRCSIPSYKEKIVVSSIP